MTEHSASLTRRMVIVSGAALLAAPALSQPDPWQTVADKARALEQCHALLIRRNGTDVVAQAFRGPRLERSVPVKSVSKTLVAALTGAALDRKELPSITATDRKSVV